MYNIEVEGDHCYRVGGQALLVHNASDPCATKCKKWSEAKKRWEIDPGLPEKDGPYADLYDPDQTSTPIKVGALFDAKEQIPRIIRENRARPGQDGRVFSDDPLDSFKMLLQSFEEFYADELKDSGVIEKRRSKFFRVASSGDMEIAEADIVVGTIVKMLGGWWKKESAGSGARYSQVYIRDNSRFEEQATVDHILAKSQGGSNSYCNAQVHSRKRGSQKEDS